ncbi:glutamine-hydrolyzing carbamoyl-phosphate synthase small subunit [Acetobacter sp.]|jgi:carbamoyl-phosphate synthase small subunit|uniref:glutamine-hydrolyzing carbamoyl-phosphate synthase small subunit n=1 Tax=Acetobacter sp. TaxID=440 RepID=UPI0025BF20EE|nr:glutamine-hydrolyzing carbamoyl-phosphate synthase small subunit [Acetobacter sp.]MCH4089970.1 glutamine-hydrolyzing carbamoyl-phosphate synthase small subunit [Acetobacter sp.]MCI1298666.1 glutamine-hydrolyzing carbamoyl-phosphate synthase small subunit [Acetobacter sp.]MCI1315231.1 glutamine-hydrolyzing carbamoyl-phosphate synthase small subunit [Acetobacter sp.]
MSLSVEAIIERVGGPEKIAALTGVGTEAVRKWRQARAIPPKHWPVVARAAGISLDELQPETPSSSPPLPESPNRKQIMSEQRASSATEVPEGATAALVLADGTVFWGIGFGAAPADEALGEICFSTGMTGYQETLTDPSFAGQIITFTFPHIGNVGTNGEDDEALRVAARGLVVKQDLTEPANWRSTESLDAWLKERNVPGICGVDTRALTLRIRDGGPQTAVLVAVSNGQIDLDAAKAKAVAWPGLEGMDLAKTVTCAKPYTWSEGVWEWPSGTKPLPTKRRKVVAVDYGAKRNILRCLTAAGCDVTVVPATTSAEEILELKPEGVFLSNGPGDPAATAPYAVPAIRGVLDAGIPVFGICLGHQLLAQALGAKTYKLAQGHRGANQPVKDIETGKVEITSQNHGFAVDEKSLPNDVKVTHISLFDKSNEGIASTTLPAFSVQYHPEASPGPSDSFYLFERFVALIDKHGKAA